MAMKKGNGPKEPLDPKVAKRLLDLLSTDDDFRELFKQDAHAALVQAGWVPGTDDANADLTALSGGSCMQLSADQTLASKEQIAQDRNKLETTLNAIQNFTTSTEFVA